MAGEVKALPVAAREVNLFTVPDEEAELSGCKEVGLVAITSDEEMSVVNLYKAAGNAKIGVELAKVSLVEADGVKLSRHDGTVDTFWNKAHPKLRQLIVGAYLEIHSASDTAQASFLKSRRVKLG